MIAIPRQSFFFAFVAHLAMGIMGWSQTNSGHCCCLPAQVKCCNKIQQISQTEQHTSLNQPKIATVLVFTHTTHQPKLISGLKVWSLSFCRRKTKQKIFSHLVTDCTVEKCGRQDKICQPITRLSNFLRLTSNSHSCSGDSGPCTAATRFSGLDDFVSVALL